MRVWLLAAAIGCCAACLFPPPDATHLYACSSPGDCPTGQSCVGGTCAPASAADAGACAAPSCAATGQLLLCDGGVAACDAGLTCDLGQCFPACGSGCAGATTCDQAAGACVPNGKCSSTSCAAECIGGICTAVPSGPSVDAGCGPLADAGAASVTLTGTLSLFPGDSISSISLDGGSVTLLLSGTSLTSPIQYDTNGVPGFFFSSVPTGSTTALVTAGGVVPTYFPNLQIVAGTHSLALGTVVSAAFAEGLSAETGYRASSGQLIWVGQAAGCGGGSYLGGYTVGLSPAPAFVGYYDSTSTLSAALTASASGAGEFVAYGAPYAGTDYAVATPSGALLQGTFVPPAYDGGALAVALVYPNFSQ